MSKIKDFIDELMDTIEWIVNGCPQPVPIPIKEDDNDREERS